jgi:hypothetical protein
MLHVGVHERLKFRKAGIMSNVTGFYEDFSSPNPDHFARRFSPLVIFASGSFAFACLIAAWLLDSHAPESRTPETAKPAVMAVAEPVARPAPVIPSRYLPLLDDASLDSAAVAFSQSAPLVSSFVAYQAELPPPVEDPEATLTLPESPVSPLVQSIPLPAPRPAELATETDLPLPPERPSAPQGPRQSKTTAIVSADATDHRSFFEKIFGSSSPSGPVLAYASPEDGLLRKQQPSAIPAPVLRYDRYTAVYDISAHVVYLPNGTRLEAHSGLGERLDDVRYVSERMRGPTPPAVYELTPREQLFHGVKALRLTPIGGEVYGRTGLLAHTYMLGPNGDSNGCVSFKNYDTFLQAYASGEIKRLAVVASLSP